jgi:hypothetical protein
MALYRPSAAALEVPRRAIARLPSFPDAARESLTRGRAGPF